MIKRTTEIPAVKINFMSEEIYDTIDPSNAELYAVEVTDNLSIPLLTPMWMDHIAEDICWLRADTFSWQSGDVYKGVYNLLKDEWDHGTPGEAIGTVNNWTYSTDLPVVTDLGTWNGAYGNGTIVLVCYGTNTPATTTGAISQDGVHWATMTMPASAPWSGVAFGNNMFVAIAGSSQSSSDVAAYSSDGRNWTATTLPSSAGWTGITYGNGKFVAVAYGSNKAAYSTDGINWTATTLPTSAQWWSVAYGNNRFVAAGGGSYVCAYSDDGITWLSSTVPSANKSVYAVTFGDNKFVAVHAQGSWISDDGATWIEHSASLGSVPMGIAYSNGTYVTASSDIMSTNGTRFYASTDGATWNIIKDSVPSLWAGSVLFAAGRFLVLPYVIASATNGYYYSSKYLIDIRTTPKGFKISTPELQDEIATLYNETGVAWYYILDTENKLFKLPRTKFGFTGLRTGPGNYVEPGLPNGRIQLSNESGSVDGSIASGSNNLESTYTKLSDFNPIFKDNANTVQPPATEMYLYFYVGGTGLTQAGLPNQAGHAGEILVTDGERADWKPNYSRNIGETIFSLLPQTDACLHLLDGALLDGNGSYAAFATYIQGLSIDYPDCFTTEENWQQSVTTYGVCGKFVYDATNNTVRLPKVTGIVEGTLTVTALGDLVEAGLPDHDHSVSAYGHYDGGNSSLFYEETGSNLVTLQSTLASVSNAIYGNSTTVQPQTIKGYYYIVVASSVKPDYVVDVDQVMTDLAAKADTTLFSTNGLYVTTYVNGTEWYREYFSDANKTQRVWLEQGGVVTLVNGYATITFLRSFSNTQYNCTATRNSGTIVDPTYKSADIVSVDSYTTLGCRMLGSDNNDGALHDVQACWVARGI